MHSKFYVRFIFFNFCRSFKDNQYWCAYMYITDETSLSRPSLGAIFFGGERSYYYHIIYMQTDTASLELTVRLERSPKPFCLQLILNLRLIYKNKFKIVRVCTFKEKLRWWQMNEFGQERILIHLSTAFLYAGKRKSLSNPIILSPTRQKKSVARRVKYIDFG